MSQEGGRDESCQGPHIVDGVILAGGAFFGWKPPCSRNNYLARASENPDNKGVVEFLNFFTHLHTAAILPLISRSIRLCLALSDRGVH